MLAVNSCLRIVTDFYPAMINRHGTRIGIGVATGADGVFVVPEMIDIERNRLLPMAMSRDTASGTLEFGGTGVVPGRPSRDSWLLPQHDTVPSALFAQNVENPPEIPTTPTSPLTGAGASEKRPGGSIVPRPSSPDPF